MTQTAKTEENKKDMTQTPRAILELNNLLPLVAIGTVADCQSVLEKTNRRLIRAGLQILNKRKFVLPGLDNLLHLTGLEDKIPDRIPDRNGQENHQKNNKYLSSQAFSKQSNQKSNTIQIGVLGSQDLAFVLSPILNSSGRLSHASLSIRTLIAGNLADAEELIATNQARKEAVKKILASVNEQVLAQNSENSNLIWVSGPFGKGIVGLLASRLVSETGKVVVVVDEEILE